MPRVVHFEIHADDPERAMRFYGDVFGWTFQRFGGEEYWLVHTGEAGAPGIDGGLMRRRDPAGAVYNTIDVPSVDEWVGRLTGAGGTLVVPKMSIPGVGWLAYFKDPEGNVHGIFQNDPAAGPEATPAG